jgi:hypothetical protein
VVGKMTRSGGHLPALQGILDDLLISPPWYGADRSLMAVFE